MENRRSPHGERGLKSIWNNHSSDGRMSLSSRRAWIEIDNMQDTFKKECYCRSPHGERGLKSLFLYKITKIISRSPHGERGLKLIICRTLLRKNVTVALLTESVD